MPQRHLPMFPAGVTHITNELAFERRDGKIAYFNGHMPVFVHAEDDVATFRMITSQFCESGYAKQCDIIRAFGVMAGPTELPDQAAFPAHLLLAPEPDRAAMGRHAQEHHPQQMLRDLRRIRANNPRIPARRGAQKVGRVLRVGHRQFSYNFTQGFSAPGVSRVEFDDASETRSYDLSHNAQPRQNPIASSKSERATPMTKSRSVIASLWIAPEHEVAFDLYGAAHTDEPRAEFVLQQGVDLFGHGSKIKNYIVGVGTLRTSFMRSTSRA